MILKFNYLECEHMENVSTYFLTTSSLPDFMDEHGCLNLPLDSEEDSGSFRSFNSFVTSELRLSSMR